MNCILVFDYGGLLFIVILLRLIVIDLLRLLVKMSCKRVMFNIFLLVEFIDLNVLIRGLLDLLLGYLGLIRVFLVGFFGYLSFIGFCIFFGVK